MTTCTSPGSRGGTESGVPSPRTPIGSHNATASKTMELITDVLLRLFELSPYLRARLATHKIGLTSLTGALSSKGHTFAVSAVKYLCVYASLRLVCVQQQCDSVLLQLPQLLPPSLQSSAAMCRHWACMQTLAHVHKCIVA